MNNQTSRVLNWLIVLAGVWEVISPFVLGYTFFPAVVNGVIVGILLIVLGGWAALTRSGSTARTLDVLNAILGVWLIASPYMLGFAGLPGSVLGSPVVTGIIVLILGVWAALENSRSVYRLESGAAVYGRGSSPNTEMRQQNPYQGTEGGYTSQPAYGRGAPGAGPRTGDYTGSDVTTRGGEGVSAPGPYRGVGPRGYQRSDERILEDLVDRLTQEDRLDASNIEVSVNQGDVALAGSVPTRAERRLAEDIAVTVLGVRNIHNDLHIEKGPGER